jgi:hypothetical protein
MGVVNAKSLIVTAKKYKTVLECLKHMDDLFLLLHGKNNRSSQ